MPNFSDVAEQTKNSEHVDIAGLTRRSEGIKGFTAFLQRPNLLHLQFREVYNLYC